MKTRKVVRGLKVGSDRHIRASDLNCNPVESWNKSENNVNTRHIG